MERRDTWRLSRLLSQKLIDVRTCIRLVCVIYEMISGRCPHVGKSVLETLHQIATHAPVSLDDLRPDLPV